MQEKDFVDPEILKNGNVLLLLKQSFIENRSEETIIPLLCCLGDSQVIVPMNVTMSKGEFKGQWEFPGGKVEEGETPQQALIREIEEELDTEIEVGELIQNVEYDYPNFHLSMDCFWAVVKTGKLVLKEAEAARWLTKEELDSVNWLPADIDLIQRLKGKL